MRFLFLRFLRLLARIARAIGATEVRFLFPKEFLERVLREMPQSLHVEVTGPITVKLYASSTAADTDFTGPNYWIGIGLKF